jgi:uncharacterized protein DUF4232
MADRDFVEADAVRVMDAFAAFRKAAGRQLQPADLGTIQEAARRRRWWRGYRLAIIATLAVLLPSGIGLGLVAAGSHRASPAPAPTATATPSLAPSPSPTATAVPQDFPACLDSDLSISLVAGGAGLGTWHALIGFTNISTQPCTIGGYPNVVAVDRTGATMSGQANPTDPVVDSSYPAGALVTLAPGEQAGTDIFAAQIDVRGQPCPPYQWLRVTAPGAYRTWEISSYFGQYAAACGAFGVSPLYPRAAFGYDAQAIISPTTSASPAAARCQASQLAAHETYGVSVANQPLTIVAFYNVSATACYLSGYVTIDAATAGSQAVPVSATHSGNYERADPGPTRVDVPPGGAASFAIGSGTAFGGGIHIITLTTLTLSPPGSGGQLRLATTIAVSRPDATGPYPLSETALVAGTNGPNT